MAHKSKSVPILDLARGVHTGHIPNWQVSEQKNSVLLCLSPFEVSLRLRKFMTNSQPGNFKDVWLTDENMTEARVLVPSIYGIVSYSIMNYVIFLINKN